MGRFTTGCSSYATSTATCATTTNFTHADTSSANTRWVLEPADTGAGRYLLRMPVRTLLLAVPQAPCPLNPPRAPTAAVPAPLPPPAGPQRLRRPVRVH